MEDILKKADDENKSTGRDKGPRQNHAQRWWKHWRGRAEMLEKISSVPRYIACSRTTRRPIFEFIHNSIHPNDALQLFPLADDYSFGILQSSLHADWFAERCSTLKRDPRYTSNTVFDSFVWPQNTTIQHVSKVAKLGRELRLMRRKLIQENDTNLRELYKIMETPGKNPLKQAQDNLDQSVRHAYKMSKDENSLKFIFELNQEVSDLEKNDKNIEGPGLPSWVEFPGEFISADAVRVSSD